MLKVDLSTLRGPELRQLLDTTRKRGQAQLSYEILQEMAARRERGGQPSGEPRMIAINLGDPLETQDDDYDEPDEAARGQAAQVGPRDEAQYEQGAVMSDEADEAPLYLGGREPRAAKGRGAKVREVKVRQPKVRGAKGRAAQMTAAQAFMPEAFEPDAFEPSAFEPNNARRDGRPDRAPRSHRALWITVGFACGMAAEAGLAWWMGVPGFPHRPAETAVAAAAPMKPAQVAEAVLPPALPPGPPLPVEGTSDGLPATATATATVADAGASVATQPAAPAEAAPAAAPAPAAAAPAPTVPSAPTSPKAAVAALPPPPDLPPVRGAARARPELAEEAGEAKELPVHGSAAKPPGEAVKLAAAGPKGCDGQPTPADRTICGDARLQRLQHELRAAYAEALDAHQDRDTLRQRQLAWADARKGVTEPEKLAKLYEERVRRLKAATEAARRER